MQVARVRSEQEIAGSARRSATSTATRRGRAELPSPEDIDPDRFRAAVLRAWESRPIEGRREALDALLDGVTLSEGGIHVA